MLLLLLLRYAAAKFRLKSYNKRSRQAATQRKQWTGTQLDITKNKKTIKTFFVSF
jgi:hypothetical protein